MLRRTVGGQAKHSLPHHAARPSTRRSPTFPLKQMRYSALIRERGGVGYYPTSGIPFVHVDSGPVRAWPRLPRYELALLFPNGQTQHKPASGGPLTREDVRVARSRATRSSPPRSQPSSTCATSRRRRSRWPRPAPPALKVPAPQPASPPADAASPRWASSRLPAAPAAVGSRARAPQRARDARLAQTRPRPPICSRRRRTATRLAKLVAASLETTPQAAPARRSRAPAAAGRSSPRSSPTHAPAPTRPHRCGRADADQRLEQRLGAAGRVRRRPPRGAVLPALPDRALPDAIGLGRRRRARQARASRRRAHARSPRRPPDRAAAQAAPGTAGGRGDVGAAVPGRRRRRFRSGGGRAHARSPSGLASRSVRTTAR